jgi:hypothetical protein
MRFHWVQVLIVTKHFKASTEVQKDGRGQADVVSSRALFCGNEDIAVVTNNGFED